MGIRNDLRENGSVEFEGLTLEYAGEWQDLQPGDSYVAQRNTGPHLLTVAFVKETLGDQDQWAGAVYPVESAYPFDLHECVKVNIKL